MSSDSSNDIFTYSSNFINYSNNSPLLAINDIWILPIVVLCLLGLLCTIILSFIFIYLSSRRLNDHFLVTNLFICFSLGFIYLILIIFLLRSNEIFCGLREFLSQLSYAFLYSALLCRYIMQWLGSRILSKRTKRFTSLLIYMLLIFIQIPIGILWWYFTIPRACQQQRRMNVFLSSSIVPKFFFNFQKPSSSISCSNRCLVDYRFYATFTYTIIELILCTILSTCLFLCRSCHRNESGDEKFVSINGNNRYLNFFHMFAFILIDFIWLIWTLIYYFTHPFYIFPSLIFSMFTIATLCLIFILLPQIYYYSKIKINNIEQYQTKTKLQSTTLYSNKLASNDQELLLEEKHPLKKSESEISYELGDSGTFLPITRTPKGPFKVTNEEKKTIEKLDELIYGEQKFNNQKNKNTNEIKVNTSGTDLQQEQYLQPPIVPLQRQSTSSSVASDFVSPVSYRHPPPPQSDISYYSAYPPPRRDETIIPILCTSERPRTSTPAQMRILVNNTPSSSVPTTRRLYSGSDIRPIRQPYSRPPVYYSPQPQQYLYIDPYRTIPSHIGGNTWQSVLLQPARSTPSSSYRRFPYDNRSLSQRLWDIDSGDDDEDEVEEDIIKVVSRNTPPPPPISTSNVHFHPDEDILLHIDDDDDEEEEENEQDNNTYRKQYAHI